MSTQGAWDPLKELKTVQHRMNRLFETALARTDFEAADGVDTWAPLCDLLATPEAMHVCLELPGLEQDEIDLSLDGDELVVSGERRLEREASNEQFHRVERSYGKFSRRFRLPHTVQRDAVEARYRDGLLWVTIPIDGDRGSSPVHVEIR